MKRRTKRLFLITKKHTLQIFELILGTALVAMGTSWFLLPNQLSTGGFSGIATIVYYLLGCPMGITILILNIPLFFMSYLKIGKEFFIKAIIGTAFLSIFIDTFDKFNALTQDRLLASIYGGIIIGLGTALVLKSNGSTGGTELVTHIIKKYVPSIRISNYIVIIDAGIVLLNVIFFKQIEVGLYSAIAIYLMGKIIDIVFEGVYFTKMMFIVSNDYKKIAKKISEELGRGSTGIYARGMYTNEKKMMLFCIASRGEYIKIKQIAKNIDENAFIVISNARETLGKGFKRE